MTNTTPKEREEFEAAVKSSWPQAIYDWTRGASGEYRDLSLFEMYRGYQLARSQPAATTVPKSIEALQQRFDQLVTKFAEDVHDSDCSSIEEARATLWEFVEDIASAPPSAPVSAMQSKWGPFRHNNGVICCGSLRVARADFDTYPAPEVQREILDALCGSHPPAVQAGDALCSPVDMDGLALRCAAEFRISLLLDEGDDSVMAFLCAGGPQFTEFVNGGDRAASARKAIYRAHDYINNPGHAASIAAALATPAEPAKPEGVKCKVFAVPDKAPSIPDMHITQGVEYEVTSEFDDSFVYLDDIRSRGLTTWKNSDHIDGGNWTRIERPPQPAPKERQAKCGCPIEGGSITCGEDYEGIEGGTCVNRTTDGDLCGHPRECHPNPESRP